MEVALLEQPFDPWAELVAYQARKPELAGRFGATAVFVGSMRDMNEGADVRTMTLEHYPGMTERELHAILAEAADQWPLLDALVMHRVGEMCPADPIVLVAVWSAHRAAAFDASRHIMEALKSRAPFWKKEAGPEGERWVEHNTPG